MIDLIRWVWVLSSALLGIWFITSLVTRYDLLHWAGRPVAVADYAQDPNALGRMGLRLLDRMCSGVVTTGVLALVFLVGTLTMAQLVVSIV